MCKHLNVSRASFYKWLNRKKPEAELENEKIAEWIKEYDQKFNHILGYRRMCNYINRDKNKSYSKHRIQRIMGILGIKSIIRKKRKTYHHSSPETVAENILHREFSAFRPNEKWTTDITEFKVPHSDKKLYLSAIVDLYDKSIVSYILSNRNNNKLVHDTLELAIKKNPNATPLFHSDRGFQYTNKTFKSKLLNYGMIQSMSRVGCCIDNSPIEGFWGTIKSEMYYITDFQTEDELIKAIEKYIYFYNNQRYQERFNNLTPMEVRAAALHTLTPVQYPIPENKRIQKYKSMIKAQKSA